MLNDREIKKALECCQDKNGYTCDDCPYQEIKHFDKEKGFEIMPNGMTYDTLSCDMWLQKDTLDYINRLEAEKEALINGQETLQKYLAEQKAENEGLQTLVNDMGDYFPACINCEGKTPLGERTDKCVYLIDNTNFCTKRGISNIIAIQKENRLLKENLETAKAEAYKEFAERIHCHCQSIINQEWNKKVAPVSWADAYEQFDDETDNLLNELVGE